MPSHCGHNSALTGFSSLTSAIFTDATVLPSFSARRSYRINLPDYAPGDLITWDLGGGVPHIGMIVAKKSPQSNHYLIVRNIGQGPKMEDVLFQWKITGHYRYFGPLLAH